MTEVAVLAIASLLPLVLQDYLTIYATRVLILCLFALSFDLVWGYAGIMSFGQAVFFGSAGYGVALIARDLGVTSMLIVLPKKVDGLAGVEESLTSEKLSAWLAKLGPRRVDVALPRFRVEAGFELEKVLPAMGMPLAFTRSADFSGIDVKRDLFISAVIHKAFVDVNEEGTEAAAATVVEMKRASAVARQPKVFRADHPFLFAILHNTTKTALFLGRLSEPKS